MRRLFSSTGRTPRPQNRRELSHSPGKRLRLPSLPKTSRRLMPQTTPRTKEHSRRRSHCLRSSRLATSWRSGLKTISQTSVVAGFLAGYWAKDSGTAPTRSTSSLGLQGTWTSPTSPRTISARLMRGSLQRGQGTSRGFRSSRRKLCCSWSKKRQTAGKPRSEHWQPRERGLQQRRRPVRLRRRLRSGSAKGRRSRQRTRKRRSSPRRRPSATLCCQSGRRMSW
mmetsp:Transcript_72698/g.168452  ORF Transcript_72698/g.168452 Transcript_72698/m.168452 type:complete len:224 (-) Transcript_72698:782-1453(-)